MKTLAIFLNLLVAVLASHGKMPGRKHEALDQWILNNLAENDPEVADLLTEDDEDDNDNSSSDWLKAARAKDLREQVFAQHLKQDIEEDYFEAVVEESDRNSEDDDHNSLASVAAQASDFDDQFIADESDFLDNSIADDDDVAFDVVAEDELEHLSDWADQNNEEFIEVAHEENGINEEESFADGEFETFDSETNVEEDATEQDDDEDDDNEDGTSDDQEVEARPEGRNGRKRGQLGMNENRSRGRKYYKPRKSRSRGGSRRSRYSTAQSVQPSNAPVAEGEDRAVGSDDVRPVDRSRFERRQRPRSHSRSRSRSRSDSYPRRHDRSDRPCFGEGCTASPRKNCTGRPSGRPTGMPHHKKWSTSEGRRSPRFERSTDQPQRGTPDAEGTPASWWSWWSF